jgi:hypothetical protein
MFAHLTDAMDLLIRSNGARVQTQLGDRLSKLSWTGSPSHRRAQVGRFVAGALIPDSRLPPANRCECAHDWR